MRARTIVAGLLIVILAAGALVLALHGDFVTRWTATHLSATDGAPASGLHIAADDDTDNPGEEPAAADSPARSSGPGGLATDEDTRLQQAFRVSVEGLARLTPRERRLAMAAADAKERLPASWYVFHDSMTSLAMEQHTRFKRGELPDDGLWFVWRGHAFDLDPFLESLFEMPLPQDHVRQILPLRGGRHALLMAYPRRIGILDAATSTAPVPAVLSEGPLPDAIPADADPVFLAPIASEEGPWLADPEGLTSPAGERRTLASEIRQRDLLFALGFDERRHHTLDVKALRYAPGGRFVAIRGEIQAPTAWSVSGTSDDPPRPEDLDRWDTPREDFEYGVVEPVIRGGFDGVLDRERGEVTPIRLWPINARPLPTWSSDGTPPKENPERKEENPFNISPVPLRPPRVVQKRIGGRTVKLTHSVNLNRREKLDLPEDRLILAVSPDGEHVAAVDFAPAADRLVHTAPGKRNDVTVVVPTYTRQINVLRRARGEYVTCLTIEPPTPAQGSWEVEIGTYDGWLGEKRHSWRLGAGVVVNPCAAFGGSDGRTFLAHQAYEMTIWRLEETPRLLLRRPTPPLGWFAVSPAGADVLGVALKRPVEGLELAGWGTDYLIDRLDGAAPRVTDLGMAFAHDDTTAMQIAFDADARALHVLYVASDERLMRQDLPRP
ncbi:MAG: hypothetical protein HY719_03355 [Planctomycetes bacterium]|nr:hypothetical protein [Planctomycetota bacterium]